MHVALSLLISRAVSIPQDYSGDAGIFGGGILMVLLVIAVVCIAGLWMLFVKAGEPGWAAIVPIYNLFVMARVAGKPMWWGILLCIPFVSFIVWIIMSLELAKRFGRGVGTAIGLIFLPPIFLCVLGF